jgi:hypothetical protein
MNNSPLLLLKTEENAVSLLQGYDILADENHVSLIELSRKK